MATVTGLTATEMNARRNEMIVDGEVVGDNLILERYDGTTIDAGNVRGPQGVPGGGGAVASVNGETGVVVLTADDVPDGADFHFVNDAEKLALATLTDIDDRLASASANGFGSVWLDDFAGADDDAKLADALSAIGADTYTRPIAFGTGERLLTDSINQPPDRTTFIGVPGPMSFGELGKPVGTRVRMDVAGPFINVTSPMYGLGVSNIDFYSTRSDTEFIRSTGAGVLWAFVGETLQFRGFYGVLGSAEYKCLMNFCRMHGNWQINGFHNTPIHVGGSDHEFFKDSLNIGSGGLGPDGGAGGQNYMMIFQGVANSHVGPIYLSCNNGWRGVSVGGTRTGNRGLFFHGMRSEGQNGSATSDGSLLYVNGGAVGFSQIVIAQGMTDPDLTGPENPDGVPDGGLIVIEGSDTQVAIDQMCVWHALGVSSDVPIVYVKKSSTPAVPLPVSPLVNISNVQMGGKSGTPTWTRIPVVKETGPGCVEADRTVEVVLPVIAEALTGAGNVTTEAVTSGTAITIDVPANIENGHVLVAAIHGRNNTAVYTTPPAGWTAVTPISDNTTAGVIRLYTHVVTDVTTEPADYTWSGGTSGRHVGMMFIVEGALTSSVVGVAGAVSGANIATDQMTPGSITTATINALLLCFVMGNTASGGAAIFSTTSGMALVGTAGTATGSAESGIAVFSEHRPSAGGTGTRTTQADRDIVSGLGYMISIKSAG